MGGAEPLGPPPLFFWPEGWPVGPAPWPERGAGRGGRAEAWSPQPERPPLPLEKGAEGGPAASRFPRVPRLRRLPPPRPRSMSVKKIAIFGATGRTGLTTLAQAVQAGMRWGGGWEMSRGAQAEH